MHHERSLIDVSTLVLPFDYPLQRSADGITRIVPQRRASKQLLHQKTSCPSLITDWSSGQRPLSGHMWRSRLQVATSRISLSPMNSEHIRTRTTFPTQPCSERDLQHRLAIVRNKRLSSTRSSEPMITSYLSQTRVPKNVV